MEETYEQLYEAAKGRIRETSALEAHEALLLEAKAGSVGATIEEHLRWVATAPEQEIVTWLQSYAPSDKDGQS